MITDEKLKISTICTEMISDIRENVDLLSEFLSTNYDTDEAEEMLQLMRDFLRKYERKSCEICEVIWK